MSLPIVSQRNYCTLRSISYIDMLGLLVGGAEMDLCAMKVSLLVIIALFLVVTIIILVI